MVKIMALRLNPQPPPTPPKQQPKKSPHHEATNTNY